MSYMFNIVFFECSMTKADLAEKVRDKLEFQGRML